MCSEYPCDFALKNHFTNINKVPISVEYSLSVYSSPRRICVGALRHPHCVRPSFWSIIRPHSVAASRYSRRPLQSARTSEFLPSLIHGVGRQRGKDRRKGKTRATGDLVERQQATWQTRHVFPDYRGVRRYGPDGTTRSIVCRDLYGC